MNKIKTISENNESTVVTEFKQKTDKQTSHQSEENLEKEFIKNLKLQGYDYLFIKNEEELIQNLRNQIERLNKHKFSEKEWKLFFDSFISNNKDSIVEKSKRIQLDWVKNIKLDNGQERNIYIIDKKNIHNNSLQVINQYENNDGKHKNRYDVTILVNGLPLVHIELKRRGVSLQEAFNQITRYKRDSFWSGKGLFDYVQIFVISNGTLTKYYSNTTRQEHVKNSTKKRNNTFEFTNYWADSKNNKIKSLSDFTKTFFSKHTILNIITKYCVFTSDERLLVMRSYQIVATERIIDKIALSHNYKKYGKQGSGGYVWHTTGSGKTLTSFKTAILATQLEYIKKVLFVVDRKDLDYQTMREYDRFQEGCANSNTNTKILQKQLEDPDSNIIITTIQKLDKFIKKNSKHDIYNEEVVIIFDECHRSQFGQMHKQIRTKFKKYYMFGFTGTPIFKENLIHYQTTQDLFGEQLHSYTIIDAIDDENVLPFKLTYINTFKGKSNILDKKVYAIDNKKVLHNDERITNVVNYILKHFDQYTKHSENYTFKQVTNINKLVKNRNIGEKKKEVSLSGFNSLFAVGDIELAKAYYSKFKSIQHNLKIGLIYSYNPNEGEDEIIEDENSDSVDGLDKNSREFLENAISNYNKMFGTSFDAGSNFSNYYKDVSMRMKNKELDLLIVVNMFLTGFDATTLNTLWVDKNLKYHGLIQAFSRTNRILNNIKKFGNIICFRNLEENLNKALLLFGNKDSKNIVILKTYDEYYYGYSYKGQEFIGYKKLIEKLKNIYPIGKEIIGERNKKDFIFLYGQILKVRNILSCFDEFENDQILTEREWQDYKSIYLDIYEQYRKHVDKEDVTDDIVFEIELIKQEDVNIDYILNLLNKYTKTNDKEILVNINKILDSNIQLRNKKDLILEFIKILNKTNEVYGEFRQYIRKKRWEELLKIISEEHLNKEETIKFMSNSFQKGQIETNGVDIAKIMPPLSRFSKEKVRFNTKNKIIERIKNFFDRYYTISDDDFSF